MSSISDHLRGGKQGEAFGICAQRAARFGIREGTKLLTQSRVRMSFNPEFSNPDPGDPLDPTAHQRTEFMLFKGEVDSHVTDKLLVRWLGSYVRGRNST